MSDAEKEARRLGISFSELVRQRLRQPPLDGASGWVRTRFHNRKPWPGKGASDMAARHDDYLYGS